MDFFIQICSDYLLNQFTFTIVVSGRLCSVM